MAPKKYKQKKKQQKEAQQKPKPLKKKKSNSNKSLFIAIGVIAVIIIVIGAIAASGLMGNNGDTNPTASPSPTLIPSSNDPYANSTYVFFHTSMGNFTVALRTDMPITTGNFVNLANQGIYDGSTFHRVIDGFMIQGGKPSDGSTVSAIQDEFTDTNHNYNMTIAMANTGAANSGTSQFFINVANNNQGTAADGTPFDDNYVAFGKVIYGEDVVMAISQVATGSNDAPEQTVTIIDARVINPSY